MSFAYLCTGSMPDLVRYRGKRFLVPLCRTLRPAIITQTPPITVAASQQESERGRPSQPF